MNISCFPPPATLWHHKRRWLHLWFSVAVQAGDCRTSGLWAGTTSRFSAVLALPNHVLINKDLTETCPIWSKTQQLLQQKVYFEFLSVTDMTWQTYRRPCLVEPLEVHVSQPVALSWDYCRVPFWASLQVGSQKPQCMVVMASWSQSHSLFCGETTDRHEEAE